MLADSRARPGRWAHELALFALVFGAYAYFYQAGGWNQNSRFDLTRALVDRGTARIDAYHRNTKDKARLGRHYYCDKAPGTSWLAVPAYASVRAAIGGPRLRPRQLALAAYVSTVWAVGLPSALAVVLLSRLLCSLGLSPRAGVAGAAAYGLGTLALPYATLLYGHQLAAALLISAFALLVQWRRRGEVGWSGLSLSGLLLGGAVAVEYPAAVAAVPIGAYALASVRPLRRLGWIAMGAALPAAALMAYHGLTFGGPFALPYEFSTQKYRHMGYFMGLGVPAPDVVFQILFSPFRGMFYSQPWLALAAPGAVFLWRRHHRAETLVCASVFACFVWLSASLVDWKGGWTLGARHLIPSLPFLAVLAAGVLAPPGTGRAGVWARRLAWLLFGLGAALGFALMFIGTAVKPEVPAWFSRPFEGFLLPAFLRGEVAVNTQTIDDASVPEGPRQAWNLGHALGLDGLASLVPLLAWLAGWGLGLALLVRRERGAGDRP